MSAVENPTLDGLDLPAVERFFASHVAGFTGRLSAELLQGGRSNLTFVLTDGRQRWVLRRPPLGGLTPGVLNFRNSRRASSVQFVQGGVSMGAKSFSAVAKSEGDATIARSGG